MIVVPKMQVFQVIPKVSVNKLSTRYCTLLLNSGMRLCLQILIGFIALLFYSCNNNENSRADNPPFLIDTTHSISVNNPRVVEMNEMYEFTGWAEHDEGSIFIDWEETLDSAFEWDNFESSETPYGYKRFISNVNLDTMYSLLKTKTIHGDFYQSDDLPIHFFLSGDFLMHGEINAVILHSPTDTAYHIEIFSLVDQKWMKKDEIIVESYPMQFDIRFEDFDFDGFNDMYIQCSASNGYSISRGHLILIDKDSKQFTQVKEARGVGNVSAVYELNRVVAEESVWCDKDASSHICKSFYRWEEKQLVFDNKECDCE